MIDPESLEGQLRSWCDALDQESRVSPMVVQAVGSSGRRMHSRVAAAVATVMLAAGALVVALVSARPGEESSNSTTADELEQVRTTSPTSSITASAPSVLPPQPATEHPGSGTSYECDDIEEFARFRDVALSDELASNAERLTLSLGALPGVRDVVFSADGNPTIILDPHSERPRTPYDALTSCVSDDDIAAVKAAATTLANRHEGAQIVVGYYPFADSILLATDLDEATVRAALPVHLTERQLSVEPL